MKEYYVNLNLLSKNQFDDFWNFVFKKANQFTLRFPNYQHSTSNQMDIKYNDNAQIDETFCNYLNKNFKLINECSDHLIRKSISNKYFDDKYSNLSVIYHCKMFDNLKKLVFGNPNIFDWSEPDLPEDLSFLVNNELFVYICSHEQICILYVDAKEKAQLEQILS